MAQHKNYHWRPKKARKPRTTGMDMCTGCIAFGCDPMSMSKNFDAMKRARRDAGLCVACGHNPCQCKSSDGLPKRDYGPKHYELLRQKRAEEKLKRIANFEVAKAKGIRPKFFTCTECGSYFFLYKDEHRVCTKCGWDENWPIDPNIRINRHHFQKTGEHMGMHECAVCGRRVSQIDLKHWHEVQEEDCIAERGI